MSMAIGQRQHGSVIIVTLWTITLMTILVTVIASQNRLSADTAWVHKQELTVWASQQSAINQAEMEVMMARMPLPVAEQQKMNDVSAQSLNKARRNPLYRYNGQLLGLAYPQAQDLAVRIYDHAGKINLREISRPRLRALIEKKLGGAKADSDQIDHMMDAWNDWLDLNDGESPKGAEKKYYLSLPVPYTPRNGALETVEELLSIKGFAEVFGDVDLDAAFTVYGEDELVNLNVATVEAMQLLPGLDAPLIEKIVAWRKDNEFQGNGDVAQLVPPEKMADLRSWINSRKTTNYYTIMVYAQAGDKDAEQGKDDNNKQNIDKTDQSNTHKQAAQTAYAETVSLSSPTERPFVLKINPYQKLPLLPASLAAADEARP